MPLFLGTKASATFSGVTDTGIYWGGGKGDAGGQSNRAIVWLGNTAASAVDLTTFKRGGNTSIIYGYDAATKSFYGGLNTQAAVWRFVNAAPAGANDLTVEDGAATYLV